jgi:hypothetical protein
MPVEVILTSGERRIVKQYTIDNSSSGSISDSSDSYDDEIEELEQKMNMVAINDHRKLDLEGSSLNSFLPINLDASSSFPFRTLTYFMFHFV